MNKARALYEEGAGARDADPPKQDPQHCDCVAAAVVVKRFATAALHVLDARKQVECHQWSVAP